MGGANIDLSVAAVLETSPSRLFCRLVGAARHIQETGRRQAGESAGWRRDVLIMVRTDTVCLGCSAGALFQNGRQPAQRLSLHLSIQMVPADLPTKRPSVSLNCRALRDSPLAAPRRLAGFSGGIAWTGRVNASPRVAEMGHPYLTTPG